MLINVIVGMSAAVLTSTCLIPQVVKGFVRKKVDDLSIAWLFVGGLGTFLWFIYGILITDLIIIFANIIASICYLIIGIQKRIYA